MNKDVIYIDVEDDITAIIGKVKDAKEKIVALVPPKRIGVLQSAVNLRLLTRAAEQSNKRLVLITSNSALMSLAASAKVPIAKTLQSKPELAEISALDVDEGEDIIDGSQLPVGEHMKLAGASASSPTDSAVEDLIRENAAEDMPRATPPGPGQVPAKPRSKSGVKVPNFNQFRKKLVLIIGGGVLFLGFLIWAIFFAPHATVVITARTSDSSANAKVTLDSNATTSLAANTIKTVTAQTKKDASVEFDATGSKDIGEKATGTVTVRNCDYSSGFSLPAGTKFTSGGIVFVSVNAASVPGYSSPSSTLCSLGGSTSGKATVSVQAADVGDSYNLSARSYAIDSIPAGSKVDAVGTDMAGGSKRTVKVPTASDIQKATDQLTQQNTDTMKSDLKKQLPSSATVIDQTFKVTQSDLKSVPAVNEEATSGKAKLTASVTYSISGVERSEYSHFLDDFFAKQIEGKNDQRVYDNGAKKVTFTDVVATDKGFTGNIVANAKIGPKINDSAIKELAKGKRYGDIQAQIEAIQGVDNVDIKFSPFWVSSVPNDTKKISIEFKLNE
jgi:hypothetical protein